MIASLLIRIGGQARAALPLGIALGLALPAAAATLRPALPAAVIALLVLSIARVPGNRLREAARRWPAIVLALAWMQFAVPPAIALIGGAAGVAPDLLGAAVLVGASAPLMSGVAFALLLGLDAALAVILAVPGTLLTAISLPLAAALVPETALAAGPAEILARAGSIVVGSCLAAFAARRFFGGAAIEARARALDGVNVILLVVFAVAVMDGMTALAVARPGQVALFVAGALVLNLGLQFVTTLLFLALGRRQALTVGFVAGFRNAALLLAVLPGPIDAGVALFVAVAQFPIYLLPSLMWRFYRRAAGA